jgi:hypothetical protein
VALFERAVVEGDGVAKGIVVSGGVHGRVVTPLTAQVVPGLFGVLFAQGKRFDLVKVWGATIEQYLGCEVAAFDLWVMGLTRLLNWSNAILTISNEQLAMSNFVV